MSRFRHPVRVWFSGRTQVLDDQSNYTSSTSSTTSDIKHSDAKQPSTRADGSDYVDIYNPQDVLQFIDSIYCDWSDSEKKDIRRETEIKKLHWSPVLLKSEASIACWLCVVEYKSLDSYQPINVGKLKLLMNVGYKKIKTKTLIEYGLISTADTLRYALSIVETKEIIEIAPYLYNFAVHYASDECFVLLRNAIPNFDHSLLPKLDNLAIARSVRSKGAARWALDRLHIDESSTTSKSYAIYVLSNKFQLLQYLSDIPSDHLPHVLRQCISMGRLDILHISSTREEVRRIVESMPGHMIHSSILNWLLN